MFRNKTKVEPKRQCDANEETNRRTPTISVDLNAVLPTGWHIERCAASIYVSFLRINGELILTQTKYQLGIPPDIEWNELIDECTKEKITLTMQEVYDKKKEMDAKRKLEKAAALMDAIKGYI